MKNGWKNEPQRHSMARKGVRTVNLSANGKYVNQYTNQLFDFNNAQETVEKLMLYINAPYVKAYHSSLGGKDKVSILITISLDPPEKWPHGILQNSNYMKLHLYSNGDVEYICGNKIGGFRKIKSNSLLEATEKINKYLDKEKKPILPIDYDEMERKYPDNLGNRMKKW